MTADGYVVAADATARGVALKEAKVLTAEPINVTETGENDKGESYWTLTWLYKGHRRSVTRPRGEICGGGLVGLSALGAPVNRSNVNAVLQFLQAQEAENNERIPHVKSLSRAGMPIARHTPTAVE